MYVRRSKITTQPDTRKSRAQLPPRGLLAKTRFIHLSTYIRHLLIVRDCLPLLRHACSRVGFVSPSFLTTILSSSTQIEPLLSASISRNASRKCPADSFFPRGGGPQMYWHRWGGKDGKGCLRSRQTCTSCSSSCTSVNCATKKTSKTTTATMARPHERTPAANPSSYPVHRRWQFFEA